MHSQSVVEAEDEARAETGGALLWHVGRHVAVHAALAAGGVRARARDPLVAAHAERAVTPPEGRLALDSVPGLSHFWRPHLRHSREARRSARRSA